MAEEEYRKEDEIPSCLDVCPTCNNELPLSNICPACGPTDDEKGGTHEGLDIEVRKAIDEAFEDTPNWREQQDAYIEDYFNKVIVIAKETGVPVMKAVAFIVHESMVSFMMVDLGENAVEFLLRVAGEVEGNPVTPEQEKAYRERIAMAKKTMERQMDGSAHK